MADRRTWSTPATEVLNEWIVADPARFALWRGAARDSLSLGHTLSRGKRRPFEVAVVFLSAHLRLHLAGAAPHLASPDVEWMEIATALLLGLEG
jgi:hypothetical protein